MTQTVNIHRFESAEQVAPAAAAMVASCATAAIRERGQFTLALSGGSTPWRMLEQLAGHDLPWDRVHLVQVDERQAPDGDPDRNLTHIKARFADRVGIHQDKLHAMPVNAPSPAAGARSYAEVLVRLAGDPPVLDLVHLGLGGDGHTASLLPGDRLLDEERDDVGWTPEYQGRPRMSLTFPVINRARNILWLILGQGKADMLNRLLERDRGIPAGRVARSQAVVFTDIQA